MIFAVSKFIAGLFGWDISVVQKRVILAFMFLIVVAVIACGLWLRACLSKPAKIDIKNVEKINRANESERLKELEKTIVDNANVVKTVDQRNTIAEVSETERQAQIYVKIREADAKISEAKSQGRDVSSEELECILTGVCK